MNSVSSLKGVNCSPADDTQGWTQKCLHIENQLQNQGTLFKNIQGHVPWLMACEPFCVSSRLKADLEQLGKAIFSFLDAIQYLYAAKHPTVTEILDFQLPKDIRGLDLDQNILTFRLDIILENGKPKVTEIEETYASAGKLHALYGAYGLKNNSIFESFHKVGFDTILLDDTIEEYLPEFQTVCKSMSTLFGSDIDVDFFSNIDRYKSGKAWRFCYPSDFAQYDDRIRTHIKNSNLEFMNPRFHAYSSKVVFTLLFHDQVCDELRKRMGEEDFHALIDATPYTFLLKEELSQEEWDYLIRNRKKLVLKVCDTLKDTHYKWGAKGVFFGNTQKHKWENALTSALMGQIPNAPEIDDARFIVSNFVDSDRFDVPFWHPAAQQVSIMDKARIRLEPIYFRHGHEIVVHPNIATFVNTSYKVHLGSHAICAPMAFEES